MANKNSSLIISQENIEKVLKANKGKVNLEKIGKPSIEQAEFKRDLTRALEILNKNYTEKGKDENYSVLGDYNAVVNLMKEVDVAEDSICFESLMKVFMPEDFEETLKAEKEKNSQKDDSEKGDEPKDDSEKGDEPKDDGEKGDEPKDDSEKGDEPKDDGEKGNDSVGRNIRDIIQNLQETHETRRASRDSNKVIDGSILKGLNNIAEKAEDILVNGKILKMNGGILHDLTVGAIVGVGTAAAATIYTAGKLTLKLAKEAKNLVGKTFTAAKGTAQRAKEKADRKRESQRIEKTNTERSEEEKVLGKAKESVSRVNRLVNKRVKENREICDQNNKQKYLDELATYSEYRLQEEEALEVKNAADIKNKRTIAYDIVEQYKLIIYKNMYAKLKMNFPGLSDEKIKDFISASGIRKGQLSVPSKSYISLEQLEDCGLYETLEKTNKIEAYLNQMNETDIEDLIYLSNTLHGKIKTPEQSSNASNVSLLTFGLDEVNSAKSNEDLDISERTFEFAKLLVDLNIPYEKVREEVRAINNGARQIEINEDVLEYCYALDLQDLSIELSDQVRDIEQELAEISSEEKQTLSDKSRRKQLINIATAKIEALKKKDQGIFETIQDENGKEIKILSEASDTLYESLGYVVDVKKSKLYGDIDDQVDIQSEEEPEQG